MDRVLFSQQAAEAEAQVNAISGQIDLLASAFGIRR